MTLRIVSIRADQISVEWATGETVASAELKDGVWTIDRKEPGARASITARQGDRRCSIGMHRVKDGRQMQPDYSKLRKLLFGDEHPRKGSMADSGQIEA